jgi:uncharacterized membrane protein YkvA (DUF1232 family)
MKALDYLKDKSKKLKAELYALSLAYKDKRVGIPARLVIIVVVAYALSPIDLIPDFIPVFGLLDDLILIPLGIALAIRLIPKDVLAECRAKAEENAMALKMNKAAAIVIIIIWLAVLFVLGKLIFELFAKR